MEGRFAEVTCQRSALLRAYHQHNNKEKGKIPIREAQENYSDILSYQLLKSNRAHHDDLFLLRTGVHVLAANLIL